jgi:hypothetical protein
MKSCYQNDETVWSLIEQKLNLELSNIFSHLKFLAAMLTI